MDVFNSALRNPLPPSRRQYRQSSESGPTSDDDPTNSGSGSPKQSTSLAPREDADFRADNKKKASRRKHRNSHLGCGICKKRRIKCDENLPQCFNCVKGKLKCAYLKLDAPARNALRMAQYNQNLRDDKQEEVSYAADIVQAKFSVKEPQADPSQVPLLVNHPEYYPGYGPNRMAPVSQPYIPLHDGINYQGQYPHDASLTQVANSPYGPVMQFQSLTPGMAYAVPVQIVNAPQVMYQGTDLLQYNTASHMQTLPPRNLVPPPPHAAIANALGPLPKVSPESAHESHRFTPHPLDDSRAQSVSLPVQSSGLGEPPTMAPAIPKDFKDVSTQAPRQVSIGASPLSSVDTPSFSNTLNPAKSSPTGKDESSSTTPSTNNDLGLRPPTLEAASTVTSPSLRSAGSISSQQLEGEKAAVQQASHSDVLPKPYESNVKLAPIRAKTDGETEVTPETVKDAEKVPSIRMLLS